MLPAPAAAPDDPQVRDVVTPMGMLAVVDFVLEVVDPAVPDGVRRALADARPRVCPDAVTVDGVSQDAAAAPDPTCLA